MATTTSQLRLHVCSHLHTGMPYEEEDVEEEMEMQRPGTLFGIEDDCSDYSDYVSGFGNYRGFSDYDDYDDHESFDDGPFLPGEEWSKMAVERARALRPKSSTVSEILGELCYARWIFLRSNRFNRLPLEARHLIRSFVLSPTAEMAGRKIVGLHNGHAFAFHSMASLPAGKLMCQVGRDVFVDKVWSLADYCTSLGCPVSEEAPVALATRGLENLCSCNEPLIPIPAEFAVIIQGDASPAESSFDMILMDSAHSWFDDVEVYGEGGRESDEEHKEWPARRQGKIPRDPERHLRQGSAKRAFPPKLPQDVELQRQLENCEVHNDGSWSQRIRNLLLQGANPIHCTTTFEKVGNAKASLRAQLDGLRAGRLCPHQAHFSYRYADNFEAIKTSAQDFMDHLGRLDEVLELLPAVVKVWERAVPAPVMWCSKDCLHGRGVLRPDAACLLQALHATPRAQLSDQTDILALAERIRNMQQSWKAPPPLSKEQRKQEKRQRQRQRKRERVATPAVAEEQLLLRLWSSESKNGPGARCNLCGVRGDHLLFSRKQRSKEHLKRCKQCIEAQKLGVVKHAKYLERRRWL
ncbi:unnamed protein product [Symbiodinium sp. CCMP2456]|nr:unnamed protein product [Symbiodinium sp. CCMP2456]